MPYTRLGNSGLMVSRVGVWRHPFRESARRRFSQRQNTLAKILAKATRASRFDFLPFDKEGRLSSCREDPRNRQRAQPQRGANHSGVAPFQARRWQHPILGASKLSQLNRCCRGACRKWDSVYESSCVVPLKSCVQSKFLLLFWLCDDCCLSCSDFLG